MGVQSLMPSKSLDQAAIRDQSFDGIGAARRESAENAPLLLTMSSNELSDTAKPSKSEVVVSQGTIVSESYLDDARPSVGPGNETQGFVGRVYRRRWIGVAAISLLNFMSAFSVIIYAPVADIARAYFHLSSLTPINWIYISAMFVYVVVSPISIYCTRYGARTTIIVGAALLISGSWLRYLGTRLNSFACVLVGSILCGASQPFALNIPTHYTDLWFAQGGRVTATALMSLSNPLGQAVASLVVPFMATEVSQIPDMTLYVAILFTGSTVITLFTPTRPPTPVSLNAQEPKTDLVESFGVLRTNKGFRYLFILISIYVALFNALATLLEQITGYFGFTNIQAGIISAVLVVFGLVASAVMAPVLDRTGAYRIPISISALALGISYFSLIFAVRPVSSGIFILVIVFAAVIGAASLTVLPLVLELASEVTFPVRPELSASMLWMAGQLLSGIVIVVMDALRERDGRYLHALVFMAVLAAIPVPFAFALATSTDVAAARQKQLQRKVGGCEPLDGHVQVCGPSLVSGQS